MTADSTISCINHTAWAARDFVFFAPAQTAVFRDKSPKTLAALRI